MSMTRFFLAVACAANLLALAPRAETLTGRVVDGTSGPLTAVRVTLSRNKAADTTVADGRFELQFGTAAIFAGAGAGAPIPGFSIRNGRAKIRIERPSHIGISLYAATGGKIATVTDKSYAAGGFEIPLAASVNGLHPGLYVLAVSIGESHSFSKILVAGESIPAASGAPASDAGASYVGALSKGSASAASSAGIAPDTLTLAKSGFFTKKMALESVASRDLGDVTFVQDIISVRNVIQDKYDEAVMDATSKSGLDASMAMVIKAMIVAESGFNAQAISMYDITLPCGTHSYGLIQVTPGCVDGYATLPAGTRVTATISGGLSGSKPVLTYADPADRDAGNTIVQENGIIIDLVTNAANPLWETSAFNPAYCLAKGTKTIKDVIDQMKRKASCTEANYVAMALAGYNQGEGTVNGCTSYSANGQNYANSVLAQYRTFCKTAGVTALY
jgi:hypothetical protein